jgi:hypothetical protein
VNVGVVSDRRSSAGTPLNLHNIGGGAQEEDLLFGYTIIGHYRGQAQESFCAGGADKDVGAPSLLPNLVKMGLRAQIERAVGRNGRRGHA